MLTFRSIKINHTNLPELAHLISWTYQSFNNQEGSPQAVKNYLQQFNLEENSLADLQKRFNSSTINFSAFVDGKMVGIVRGRKDRLVNLFVVGEFHRQGIGRELVRRFEESAKKEQAKVIKIRASLFARDFYSRLGYQKTTGVRMFHGLKIQPMKKVL